MSSFFFSVLEGTSVAITQFRQQLDDAMAHSGPWVLLGERATGKLSVAFEMHQQRGALGAPFIHLDCATLEPSLAETTLFGHVEGAFSGAICAGLGRLEMARGGTLFLDGIECLPSSVRTKLFDAIAQGRYVPFGANQSVMVDVRCVLGVTTASFSDQAWLDIMPVTPRLSGLNVLRVPALSERLDDIECLFCACYLACFPQSSTPPSLALDALARLEHDGWPDNLDDLARLVTLLGDSWHGRVVLLSDLPARYSSDWLDPASASCLLFNDAGDFEALSDCWGFAEGWSASAASVVAVEGFDLEANEGLKRYLQDVEVALIAAALKRCEDNVSQTAKLLKLNRTTLIEKMKKYALYH
ncbi:sigma-54-dependent transcriptional regulator [Thiomicrospira microaerophila]|uniref:sigma-54-dependent transcriptional regulator n=1 Tax=Thiomicrospira microaerophila TaxID=406020 RepID=UPI0005CAB55C|nr:sigma 54-interacting transcriptional regulator [Thiomicrospira microaerophila]